LAEAVDILHDVDFKIDLFKKSDAKHYPSDMCDEWAVMEATLPEPG